MAASIKRLELEPELSLAEVAALLHCTRENVRQIESNALRKCRLWCRQHGYRFEDLAPALRWKPDWQADRELIGVPIHGSDLSVLPGIESSGQPDAQTDPDPPRTTPPAPP